MYKPPKFRQLFSDEDPADWCDVSSIPADGHGESKTVQSMAEDADINVLMRRFGLLGTLPQGSRIPEYGDYSGVSDYKSALLAVKEAQASFDGLPADVRQRFDNDPQLFLEFASDPANVPELVKIGLGKEIPRGDIREPADAGAAAGANNQAAGAAVGGVTPAASGGS